jgi:transcriptional regulator with XRE-family HTH domain
MDEQRVGRVLRTLRHRLGWRQVDVARVANLTQDDVSRGERGRLRDVSKLRRQAAAVDAEVFVSIRWRGGEIDRLLDEGHASIVGWIVATLTTFGWEVHPEASYSIWGERGSIDVLAWHEETRTLLVVEVKTELTSLEETLRKHDTKQRLAPEVARERFGWGRPAAVCRLLVLPETTTARRRVERQASVLDAAYRRRGTAARAWLARPSGAESLMLFAPVTREARHSRRSVTAKRIRRSSAALKASRHATDPSR